MSVGYLAVLTLTSEGGLMYALAVFLTVASGRCVVFGLVEDQLWCVSQAKAPSMREFGFLSTG